MELYPSLYNKTETAMKSRSNNAKTQITFVLSAKENYDTKWLNEAIKKLKGLGVIQFNKEIAKATETFPSNLTTYINGTVQPSKPFIRKFLKVYGKYLDRLTGEKQRIKELEKEVVELKVQLREVRKLNEMLMKGE